MSFLLEGIFGIDLRMNPLPPNPSSAAPVVVLDDDDDIQVCSPRTFFQCKRDVDTEDDLLQLRLGVSEPKSSVTRKRSRSKPRQLKQKQKRVATTIDLTSSDEPECEVIEKKDSPAKEVKLTCAICFETMKNETSTVCGHIFCSGCILSAIKVQKKCPTCRKKLTPSMVHRIYLCGGA